MTTDTRDAAPPRDGAHPGDGPPPAGGPAVAPTPGNPATETPATDAAPGFPVPDAAATGTPVPDTAAPGTAAPGTPAAEGGAAASAAHTADGEPAHPPVGRPGLAALLAWLFPGLGHLYLRRWGRALAFCALVLTLVVAGTSLEGRLWSLGDGGVVGVLFTAVSAALGVPYGVLLASGYAGDVAARGYEYGTAFLLTAALMNLLLVLDARDVSLGRKP